MRGFFATVAMMSSLLASGQYVINGVCCDPDGGGSFLGTSTCNQLLENNGEQPGNSDGVVCDPDCGGYDAASCFVEPGCTDATACNYDADANVEDGSCEYASCTTQYSLTVESAPAVGAGGTVYRFYVDMQDATDRMSAVFGNDQASL